MCTEHFKTIRKLKSFYQNIKLLNIPKTNGKKNYTPTPKHFAKPSDALLLIILLCAISQDIIWSFVNEIPVKCQLTLYWTSVTFSILLWLTPDDFTHQ